jgi:plastocyanin
MWLAALVAISTLPGIAVAAPPTPEPGFLSPNVPTSNCTPQTSYEKRFWPETEGAYGKACRRLHFSYGPIVVKPGQDDVLVGPVSIEKPWYDGYIVRFKPNLVDSSGRPPSIADVHLHHATWLNGYPQYGNGPFFAAGEEKTIATFPKGYGMHVGASDSWALLYMVHNELSTPTVVWITYEIDYIAQDAARKLGIDAVRPIWLDVQRQPIAPGAPDTSGNPVFNVQQGFGRFSPEFHRRVCEWPRENCARFDVYGDRTPQQGKPARVAGADFVVPKDLSGTIVGLGGHLHPGGLADRVSLVRHGVEKPIFESDAVYWNRRDPHRCCGPDDSWDFSMTATGAPLGWKVKIKPGDILRLNAVYDSSHASWYENMGIVVAYVAPHDTHGPSGIDVFDPGVKIGAGVPTTAIPVPGWRRPSCHPYLTGAHPVLCLGGQITHGHLPEADPFGGCGGGGCTAVPKKNGPFVSNITIANFTYGQADLGVAAKTGVPRVRLGQPLTFWNADTSADIWHTVTQCRLPCTGAPGLAYPVATGDLESMDIGWGVFFSPAKGQIGWNKTPSNAIRDGAEWTFTPSRTGVYAFFCRIHPFMRGVIQVVK